MQYFEKLRINLFILKITRTLEVCNIKSLIGSTRKLQKLTKKLNSTIRRVFLSYNLLLTKNA